jgi:hypothetical protein
MHKEKDKYLSETLKEKTTPLKKENNSRIYINEGRGNS